jgi:Haem-binding domain/Cytochrome P460
MFYNLKFHVMKRVRVILVLLLAIFIAIQFIHPSLGNPPVTGDFNAPPQVKAIFERACYDCHSNQTRLRWYDEVAPAYWRVWQDVKDGRQAMNFSNWDSLNGVAQLTKLFEAVFMIEQQAMPLPAYTTVHHGGVVTAEEVKVLKQYVATLGYHPALDTSRSRAAGEQFERWIPGVAPAGVKDAPNGIAYGPLAGYGSWQVVSTNERFDYGIMHVILANPIAVKAIREGQTDPYPDGAIFAKPAWLQMPDSTGEIQSGAFLQTEFMIRDSRKYAGSFGWGWARWVHGAALDP